MSGLGELWVDCDFRSWWDVVFVDTKQCLRRRNQGRGSYYLNEFLVMESRSELQLQEILERIGSTTDQRISRREIKIERDISRRGVETQRESKRGAEMAMNILRDQDTLDKASNFVIWKAKILAVLDRHRIKDSALKVVAIPFDPTKNEKHEEAMTRVKCMILNGVKDHVIYILLRRTQQKRCGTS